MMTTEQLRLAPARVEQPSKSAMVALRLRPAVFYWASRELAAGRPLPCRLTDEQLAYMHRFLPVAVG